MNQNMRNRNMNNEEKGQMTVEQAGHKGGQRVRQLVEEGKEEEGMGKSSDEENM